MNTIVYEGYVTRDQNGDLKFRANSGPISKHPDDGRHDGYWYGGWPIFELDDEPQFDNLTFDSEPIEARIKIEII